MITENSSNPNSSHDAKRQLWIKRFEQFQKSNLSIAQFCQSVGCSIKSFYLPFEAIDLLPCILFGIIKSDHPMGGLQR